MALPGRHPSGVGAAQRSRGPVPLPDHATVAVIGGGPAGSFFALRLLRRSRAAGKVLRVVMLEKKTELAFYQPEVHCGWEGCNYCAGGISPRLADILREEDIHLPEEIIESRAQEVVVHGDWKSVRLPVPSGREMLSVFRGSRPRQRPGRYHNFDSFLLEQAMAAGAEVITGEAVHIRYEGGLPVVAYRTAGPGAPEETLRADFAVFAGGVNRSPGMDLKSDPLLTELRALIPGLELPRVRPALIAEMQAVSRETGALQAVDAEVHFCQYGSKDLHIEMSSLIPKHDWVTVVLLGKSIDRAGPSEYLGIMQRFVELPHIRRLLPPGVRLRAGCSCHPNMAVGAARRPFGTRIALIGDLAVSRLYKDGLFSAWTTSAGLADCLLDAGIDQPSLRRRYAPVVRGFARDNVYGRMIFAMSRAVFSHPAMSRVLYQAVLSERRHTREETWRLAPILWQIASGDRSYRHIFGAMLRPGALWSILVGGLLTTIRNQATERLFGLDWTGLGRHQTGVSIEERVQKRTELFAMLALEPPTRSPETERVYSIRIRASAEAIFRQLGRFGDPEREYLWPRFLSVKRMSGEPNRPGTVIRYAVGPGCGGRRPRRCHPFVSFSVRIEQNVPGRYLLYRIVDGFGREGLFAFDVRPLKEGVQLLSIYVGFDFYRGKGPLGRIGCGLFRSLFPGFAHDVVWNHSLCKIRYLAELDDHPLEAPVEASV
jgi:flavin-dependent dehydrogenase